MRPLIAGGAVVVERDRGAAVTFDQADGTPDGAGVVVGFWGWRADGPCGAEYDVAAVEAGTVAITVRQRGHDNTRICPSAGLRRTAVARLGSPLGDRIVVDASTGQVVTR